MWNTTTSGVEPIFKISYIRKPERSQREIVKETIMGLLQDNPDIFDEVVLEIRRKKIERLKNK